MPSFAEHQQRHKQPQQQKRKGEFFFFVNVSLVISTRERNLETIYRKCVNGYV